jgi:glycosyltransferase involved in cell wall biosynthesis
LKQVLLVLGMHRSGTSALVSVLERLGAIGARTPMPANEYNERGYGESVPIMGINEQILSSAGTTWKDWAPINEAWFGSHVAKELSPVATKAFIEEFYGSGLVVLKDPRISRLLPFWRDCFQLAGYEIKPIICFRHPAEVAASLAHRDGMPLLAGMLLWLRHTLDAELATRGEPRVFVNYAKTLFDWRAVVDDVVNTLGVQLPRRSFGIEAEVDALIDSSLHHHRVASKDTVGRSSIPGWIRRTYDCLLQIADQGENATHLKELDRVRQEFDSASSIFGMLAHDLDTKRTRAESALETTSTALQAIENECATLRDQLQASASRFDTLATQMTEAALLKSQQVTITDLQTAKSERDQLNSRVGALRTENTEMTAQLEALKVQIASVQSDANALRADRDLFAGRADAASEENKVLESSTQLLSQEVQALRTALAATENSSANARKKLETSERELIGMRISLAEARVQATSALQAQTQAMQALETKLQATEAARDTLTGQVQSACEERDSLIANLEQLAAVDAETRRTLRSTTADLAQALKERDQLNNIVAKVRSETESTHARLETLTTERDSLVANLERLAAMEAETRRTLQSTTADLAQASKERDQLNNIVAGLRSETESTHARLETLTTERDSLVADLERLSAMYAETRGGLQSTTADLAQASKERDQLNNIVAGLRSETESTHARLETLTTERDSLVTNLERLTAMEAETRRGLQSTSAELEHVRKERDQLNNIVATLRNETESTRVRLDMLQDQNAVLVTEADQLRADREHFAHRAEVAFRDKLATEHREDQLTATNLRLCEAMAVAENDNGRLREELAATQSDLALIRESAANEVSRAKIELGEYRKKQLEEMLSIRNGFDEAYGIAVKQLQEARNQLIQVGELSATADAERARRMDDDAAAVSELSFLRERLSLAHDRVEQSRARAEQLIQSLLPEGEANRFGLEKRSHEQGMENQTGPSQTITPSQNAIRAALEKMRAQAVGLQQAQRAETMSADPHPGGTVSTGAESLDQPLFPLQSRQRAGLSGAQQREADFLRPHIDTNFYLAKYPSALALGLKPAEHYVLEGWKKGYDPSPTFSTSYYLKSYPDIAASGMNPLLHYVRAGKAERREGAPYHRVRRTQYRPLVSVIVPNYNHAKYLPQRIASITDQTYDNFELIVLDDASKDNSVEVLDELLKTVKQPVVTDFSETNSGNVFAQWQKGIGLARGELVWICESDDYCEPDFLENLVGKFAERSVMMAFGRIEFCDKEGNHLEGMAGFREQAEPGIWGAEVNRPASQWFSGAFGIRNVMSNVGGCLFRRQSLPADVWRTAREFKIAGDWYLYLHMLGGGKLVFEPAAVAYFRQHGQNTSASNFNKMYYYAECMRILEVICANWNIPIDTRVRFWRDIEYQYKHFGMPAVEGEFEAHFPMARYLEIDVSRMHLIVAMLGFSPGGGELLPLNLANYLAESGHRVSILAVAMDEINEDMFGRVKTSIPVYCADDVRGDGARAFVRNTGASVIHSHMINCEYLLLTGAEAITDTRYVVSLHGSYDSPGGEHLEKILEFVSKVTTWVYTADKNLAVFHRVGLDTTGFLKIANGMPTDERPAPFTRADLGISETAVVFTLVARGIKQKGWRAVVEAFRKLVARNPHADCHLLLVGEGPATDEAQRLAQGDHRMHFLGYQSEINGIYRLSTCALVPSRFDGESFPLCIIQALQEGIPVIGTDIGEIRNMITSADGDAGLVVPNLRNSEAFIEANAAAMSSILDGGKRAMFTGNAKRVSQRFSMEAMAKAYLGVYES